MSTYWKTVGLNFQAAVDRQDEVIRLLTEACGAGNGNPMNWPSPKGKYSPPPYLNKTPAAILEDSRKQIKQTLDEQNQQTKSDESYT